MPHRPHWQPLLRHATAGLEFIVTFGLPLAGGLLLDQWLGTIPGLTLVGAILGFAGGTYQLVRHGREIQQEWGPGPSGGKSGPAAGAAKGVSRRAVGAPGPSPGADPDRLGMRISIGALLGWTVPAWLMAGAVGIWPTWVWHGPPGLWAELAAAGIVLLVMLLSGAVTVKLSRKGPGRAAFAFMVFGMLRVLVCVGLAAAAWALWDLPVLPLAVWLVIFYLVVLAGEGIWMTRALQRDAFLVALGEIRRPGL